MLAGLSTRPKIIFVLRHPSRRVLSTYRYFRDNRSLIDRELTFTDFVRAVQDGGKIFGDNEFLRDTISQGQYADYLVNWRRGCGEDRIVLLLLERLSSDPAGVMRGLARRLSIDPDFYDRYEFSARNESYRIRNSSVQGVNQRLRALIPAGHLRDRLRRVYLWLNTRRRDPELSERDRTTLAELDRYYAPHNETLCRGFDLDLSPWESYRAPESGGRVGTTLVGLLAHTAGSSASRVTPWRLAYSISLRPASHEEARGPWLVSALVCLLASIVLLGLSDDAWHWFIIPVSIAGIIITRDAVEWLSGRIDLFNPIGLLGVYGSFTFFMFAPFLHVYWGFWWDHRFVPQDWRPWLGLMALMNIAGLLLYRLFRRFAAGASTQRLLGQGWKLNPRRFTVILTVGLIMSGLLQVMVYLDFGGLSGFIEAHEERIGRGWWVNPFLGKGWLFTFAESFSPLAALGFVVFARSRERWKRPAVLVAFLLLMVILELVFGGLRGNRSGTVFGLFWTIGLIHMNLRRLTRTQLGVGVLCMFVFMNVYYFYKHAGREGIQALGDPSSRERLLSRKQIEDERKFIVLHDFGRADIQALALHHVSDDNSDYRYAFGRTYLGGLASVVPRGHLAGARPATVREERDSAPLRCAITVWEPELRSRLGFRSGR